MNAHSTRTARSAALLLGALALLTAPAAAALGDPITVIQRPLQNIPAIVPMGTSLTIECEAPASTSGWRAGLLHPSGDHHLVVTEARFDADTGWWTLRAAVPDLAVTGLYDLEVTAEPDVWDVARHAVQVLQAFKTDYYFAHITDSHLPGHSFYDEPGSASDTSEEDDLRMVIEDLNVIRPEFVLFTGDVVNEGELEDVDERHVFSRAQDLLLELEVPVYVVAGNHDIGGWEQTPGAQGSARRNWWRFFGWPRLDDPPPGAPARTQDYSFDYGDIHFVGLEAYDNYDGWRSDIYGRTSFTDDQLDWLAQDLAASSSAAQVLFFHHDFDWQVDARDWDVEMRLCGHVHEDVGAIDEIPYDLATAAVCDEARAFRLIDVSGSALTPRATLSAGWDGERLDVAYQPSNDGTQRAITATVDNRHWQPFAHAELRFRMPADSAPVTVQGGTLLRVEPRGRSAVFVVGVALPADSSHTVTVRGQGSGDADSDVDTDTDADADGGGSGSGGCQAVSGGHTRASLPLLGMGLLALLRRRVRAPL